MLHRLACPALLAGLLAASLAVSAWSQSAADRGPDGAGQELAPLWRSGSPRIPGPRAVPAVRAPLAPLVASSLPEDAAWEGLVTPASSGASAKCIEYQGKLVIQNAGVAGSIASPYLSMWDGSRFEPLPALGFGPQALGIWNAHLVVACGSSSFSINPILMLDGSAWDTLGVANSSVSAFCEYQGFLAAGGAFSSVNGVPASSVAVFDGVTWSAPGTGLSGNVTSLTTHAGGLVAAVQGSPLKCVALDALGGAWHTVGAGFTGSAYSVLSDGTYLYACGQLIASGAVPMGCLARWDGSSWASLTTVHVGFSEQRMTRWNGRIVVTGRAGTVGLLGQWDGASYGPVPGDSLGFGDGNNAFNLSTWGTKLIVTGNFVTNGSVPVPRLATYDGGTWGTIQEPWSPGMSGPLGPARFMRTWAGKLVVTGSFGIVADEDHWTNAIVIAAWDGAHWSPLGGGLNGLTFALGEYAGDLVAAGSSVTVPGTSITRAARWNGSNWNALGTNAPDNVYALVEYQGNLYLGGDSDSGPGPLAMWSGSTWSTVPGLPSSFVFALEPVAGRLVVGGSFDQAGGIASPNVAFWDGSSWQGAGAGVNGDVYAAADWLGQIVIGGEFTSSGGTPLPGAAIWDGAAWQPLGTKAATIFGLDVDNGELFASGRFQLPDGSIRTALAHWTGTEWHVLGSGSNSNVYAFAAYGGYLYQAGIGIVNGHPSQGLSRVPLSAVLDVPRSQAGARIALAVSPNPAHGLTRLSFTLPSAGRAHVTVLDLAGRRVATLADGALGAGPHQAEWATPGAPGVYMALLETSAGRVSRRFVVLQR